MNGIKDAGIIGPRILVSAREREHKRERGSDIDRTDAPLQRRINMQDP